MTITDIDKLKSLAYDQLVQIQQAQRNLEILNARIAELQSQKPAVRNTDLPNSQADDLPQNGFDEI